MGNTAHAVKPFCEVRHGSAKYPVYVGRGLLEQVGAITRNATRSRSPFIITSSRVQDLIGNRIYASFAGPPPVVLMEDGEQHKTLLSVEKIIGELIRKGAQRDSVAIVIGGGVVGDAAGFAASIFLRGIDLVHVPTTLLAQVDSSIGGKVAVNHPLGKNLIGSFHAPRLVISDIDVLATLSPRELVSGLFEAMKSGVVGDPALFDLVADREPALEEIVKKSVELKAAIVSEDAYEGDRRRLLNFGHTIGHGIEAALRYEQLTHGEAVAWGILGANAIARRRGLLSADEDKRIREAIRRLNPDRPGELDRRALRSAIDHDKKFTAGKRVMVLAKRVGECVIAEDITEEEIQYGIAAILA